MLWKSVWCAGSWGGGVGHPQGEQEIFLLVARKHHLVDEGKKGCCSCGGSLA